MELDKEAKEFAEYVAKQVQALLRQDIQAFIGKLSQQGGIVGKILGAAKDEDWYNK